MYVSVCTLSVPPNSNTLQQNGTQSKFGMPLVVECLPGYRLSGSESNGNVNTSIQCNENGIFDQTPSCEPKGKVTRHWDPECGNFIVYFDNGNGMPFQYILFVVIICSSVILSIRLAGRSAVSYLIVLQ